MLTVALAIIVCGIILWMWFQDSDTSQPPIYPGALPIIGHAYLGLNKDKLHHLLQKVSEFSIKNDGVIQVKMGPITAYLVGDPADCLTVSNACLSKNAIYDFAKDFIGQGLFCAKLDLWKQHRKLLNPALSLAVLNSYIPVFNSQSKILVKKLAPLVGQGPVALNDYLNKHNMEVACRTSLNIGVEDNPSGEVFVKNTEEILELGIDRLRKAWLYFDFIYRLTPGYQTEKRLIATNKNICRKIIENRKTQLAKQEKQDTSLEDFDKFQPLLDLMLKLSEEKIAFTDDEITEELCTFIVATYDTSSASIALFLVMIGTHKQVQENIFKEIDDVFGDSTRDVEKGDLTKLVYLEAAIKESLRLYSVAPIISRVAEEDVKLRNFTLPAGSHIGLLLHAVNRHPIWGADADQYRPERWFEPGLPGSEAFAGFSVGKRNCIGRRFAMMSMKIVLVHLLREYKFTGNINMVKFNVTIMAKPKSGHELELELRK